MGKLAWVDLSTQTVKIEELTEDVCRRHIGGTGLAAYIFRQSAFHEINPLGPENLLIFATGPLTGTGIPTSGRYAVACQVAADRNLGRGRQRRQIRRGAQGRRLRRHRHSGPRHFAIGADSHSRRDRGDLGRSRLGKRHLRDLRHSDSEIWRQVGGGVHRAAGQSAWFRWPTS